jgi:RimJ/RimL family protein N-acetyltransferase
MIKIIQIPATEWAQHSAKVHAAVFDKSKPAEWDRIDYVLLIHNDEKAIAYISCREEDRETVYWQFGGIFPAYRNTGLAYKIIDECVKWTAEKYKRVTMRVENSNISFLKLAFKAGFRIVGTVTFKSFILCNLLLEFEDAKEEEQELCGL